MTATTETIEIVETTIGMTEGASASIVIMTMTSQASWGQGSPSREIVETKLTNVLKITETIEITVQTTAGTIEIVAQMIAVTITADATTATVTEGLNGADEQTRSQSAHSKNGWTITADFTYTRETTVGYVLIIH
jgi:hypothetical protein